jgi:hypothetical protein
MLFSCIWNLDKPFLQLLGHAGITLRKLVDDTRNSTQTVSALAGLWFGKVRLHKDAPTSVDHLAGSLLVQTALDPNPLADVAACRLWSVYRDLIEYAYGDRMDDEKYRSSMEAIGEIAAQVDHQHSLSDEQSLHFRLKSGLTEDTSDADLFVGSYDRKRTTLARQDKPTN